jgi:drug/metabolite transporter (DMT)-like permease
MAFGTLFLLPAAGAEMALSGFGPVSPGGWLSVLFLGVAGSGGSFFCWNAALRRMDASEASIYINLVPVITVASAALMLGETIGPAQMMGGALVILGVYLASKQEPAATRGITIGEGRQPKDPSEAAGAARGTTGME